MRYEKGGERLRSSAADKLVGGVTDPADMFALFDAAGYTANSTPLRKRFESQAQTLEEWAGFSGAG